MASSLTKKWSRAVWKEEDHEEELVIPSCWIEGKIVRWPSGSSAVAALKEMKSPGAKWLKFDLVKVKFSSGKFFLKDEIKAYVHLSAFKYYHNLDLSLVLHVDSKKECENYDYTTTGETTEDDSDQELPKSCKQRGGLPSDI
jgi:hypothetical protein